MSITRMTLPCAIGLGILFSTNSFAAHRINVRALTFLELQRILAVNLTQASPHLKDWKVVKQQIDHNHVKHTHLAQQYAGFRVYGGDIILHQGSQSQARSRTRMSNGVLYQGLGDDLGQPAVDYIPKAQLFLNEFKQSWAKDEIKESSVTPLIYVDKQHTAHWAYRVSLRIQPTHAMVQRPTAIIDAITHQTYETWNDLKTLKTPAHALGYGGNQHTGTYQFGRDLPALEIRRDDFAEICYMENEVVRVLDMAGNYFQAFSSPVMRFACPNKKQTAPDLYWSGYEGNGYDAINGGFSPSNDALYVGTQIQNVYKKWYHVDVLKTGHKPMPMIMRVHYGQDYANAFWDGKQMTFGDGRWDMYPLVTLDVGAHEISHGFTEQHAGLEYHHQSGGMNESFSDMAGVMAEYFVKGTARWTIGEDLFKENSTHHVLRYMDEPHRDGHSIEHVSEYKPGLDVHYSSGVYNRLFYLLATTPGWDIRKAFHVMLTANMYYWTPTSTFQEGGCGLLDASDSLKFNSMEVAQAMEKVGIICPGALKSKA